MPATRLVFVCAALLTACDPSAGPASPDGEDAGSAGKADGAGEDPGTEPEPVVAAPELDSREYKLLLDPSLFADDPDAAVEALWGDIKAAAEDGEHEPDDSFDNLRERTVTLLDERGACTLRASGLALRHRAEEGEAEVTLKLRSPDRYVAALGPTGTTEADAEFKLEEDIVAPFQSKFSRSITVLAPDAPKASDLDAPLDPFSGLDALGVAVPSALEPVGGTSIDERAYKGAKVFLAGTKAKFTVTLWYAGDDKAGPDVAEVSFSYKRGDDGFDFETARAAMDMFGRLGALDAWVAESATTKTAFAYGLDPTFCD